MKSNTSSIIAIFALFVLFSVVSGQTTSSPAPPPASTNTIAQCIKDKGCNDSDQHCRAKCAGVPDPSNSDAKNTDDCVSKCNQSDTNAYAQCKQNCINQNYFPQGGSSTNPNSQSGSTPSASSNSPGSTGSTSSGSSSSSPSSTSKANNANGAFAFTTNSNAFTALVLCIIAGVMTVGF